MSKKPEQSVEPTGVPEITKEKWCYDKNGGVIFKEKGEIVLQITDDSYEDDDFFEITCNAVNNTYGKGINPEAVPDLVEALHWAFRELLFKPSNSIDDNNEPTNPDLLKLIEQALKKAEL